MEQPQRVPIERGKRTNRRIWETVQLFDGQGPVVERAQYGASAFSAKVEGDVTSVHGSSMTTLPTLSAYSASISKASGVFSSGHRCVTICSPIRPDSMR